jgi:hypothetical protein
MNWEGVGEPHQVSSGDTTTILLCDPALLFLGTYAKECNKTTMLIAAILTIFKLWNQQRDVKINAVYIDNEEIEIISFTATWTEAEIMLVS